MIVRIEPAMSAAAQALIGELDADLASRYPAESIHVIECEGFEAAGGLFAVGYEGEVPVACGAIRPYAEGVGEIKRMYVVPAARRRGLAKAILAFLEAEGRRRGYASLVLETGTEQPEALAFYRAEGWHGIPPYGDFAKDPRSVCFAKVL